MSHRPLMALWTVLLVPAAAAPAAAQTPACIDYMPDPRMEADQGPVVLTQADALVVPDWVFLPSSQEDGTVRMQVYPWTQFQQPGPWPTACRVRDYHGQPSSGVGSAILVGRMLLLTAGHLIETPPSDPNGVAACAHQRYVFGYGNFTPGQWPITCDQSGTCWVNVPSADVYACRSFVKGGLQPGTTGDWAVVTLDRTVQGAHTPLRILRDPGQFPPVGSPVTIVGHPNRIPMKVENTSVTHAGAYRTDGHVIPGNSGSMAVDDATGLVVGVVVAGSWRLLPGCQPPNNVCYREWFENPNALAALTPAWLAKDYIPEP